MNWYNEEATFTLNWPGEFNMERTDLRSRIAIDPAVMAGKPVMRGTRLTVQFILGPLQNGSDFDEILGEYSGRQREDI